MSLVVLSTHVLLTVSNGTFDGLILHPGKSIWCVVVDFVSTGNVYKNGGFASQKICKRTCQNDPKCISVNFQL